MQDDGTIKQAVSELQKGGIIIYPTDTAFGIGCKVSDSAAVERLFQLRKRPETKAVPVLIDSIGMAQRYVNEIPPDINELMEKYWPGALTIILPNDKERVPDLVRGGGENIGLRIPDHQIMLEIIEHVGEGIVGCSANFAGEATPYYFKDIDSELINLVDYVVPGECSVKQASTVLDCSVKPWKILREGAVTILLSS